MVSRHSTSLLLGAWLLAAASCSSDRTIVGPESTGTGGTSAVMPGPSATSGTAALAAAGTTASSNVAGRTGSATAGRSGSAGTGAAGSGATGTAGAGAAGSATED